MATESPKRPSPGSNVVIDQVTFLDDDGDPNTVNSPSLLTLPSRAHKSAFENMTVRAVKRMRVSGDSEDPEEQGWEIQASSHVGDWHASHQETVLNLDYFIGIQNKKTGTMQLVEVDRTFCMRPIAGRGRKEVDDDEEDQKSYAQQKKELLEKFGGGKQLRRYEQNQQNKITDEKIDDSTVVGITTPAKYMQERDRAAGIRIQLVPTTEHLAPPHNNAATVPEECYPLHGLASQFEINALHSEAMQMIELAEDPNPLENPGWLPLVWFILQEVLQNKQLDPNLRATRIQAAMYFHYLAILSSGPKTITEHIFADFMERMALEEHVLEHLLDRFAIRDARFRRKKSWVRRPEDEQNVQAYAVVLWVTANGFKDCRRLGLAATALGISLKLLLRHAERVGCKLKKVKDVKGPDAYSITLKAPLKFPEVRTRSGKPKRRA